ncbi:type IV secretory pathway TrbL component [Paenochrobactrum gallinarii]|uniref:Type IV secretory pathway TrbL component n=1 Tax=Paenochrobactrum gallinarii TaxID=643673 RepID=A0A841M192_9HYPH|nr:type IV secretory pathway TrbL component [Paenochrobactrum gallinarii]
MMIPNDNDFDLRSRIIGNEHQITAMALRVTSLEQWQRQAELADARKDEQWKHMDNRFNDLEKKISGVSETLAKVVWLIISALILGVISFIIKGGFNTL